MFLLTVPRQTRSGKRFSPFLPLHCSALFNFEALLKGSTELESELLSDDLTGSLTSRFADETPALQPLKANGTPVQADTQRQQGLKRPASPTPPTLSRAHAKRKRLREEKVLSVGQLPRSDVIKKYVKSASAIPAGVDFATFPATNGAYAAKPERTKGTAAANPCLVDLISKGFELVPWDG